jgi:glyoxylase-like metal-dependent hydrolase (beta-lactamase superfamily II)
VDATVIDPGADLERLLDAAKRRGLNLPAIWLTHAHIDHTGGTAQPNKRLNVPTIGPPRRPVPDRRPAPARCHVRLPVRRVFHAHTLAGRWRHGADWQQQA